ncbi:MAG: hypothetical protein ACI9YE_000161 [Psychroserpens sp.]|jgi:hypothetical protein
MLQKEIGKSSKKKIMKPKTMVIGLGPDYNYDVDNHHKWRKHNTRYASNHGASLISRTLIDYFKADYVDNFDNIEEYKDKYDLCVIAFATHITERRDVSIYTDFVKKMNIKTVAFSLGIQDYSPSSSSLKSLHISLVELLNYCVDSSGFLGVRGPHTASVLIKEGFSQKNIIQIGCPTAFAPLNRGLVIKKKKAFTKPIIVFHRTMAGLNKKIIGGAPLLGQDFLDEVVFKNNIDNNQIIKKNELANYHKYSNGKFTLRQIKENGIFADTFNEWFKIVGEYDFVLGARLHGCMAALIQGIPAVMLARDVRVQEIAEFYKIPYIKYEDVGGKTIDEIYMEADFTEFNNLYKYRFDNFMKLLSELEILDHLSFEQSIPKDYHFSLDDLNANTEILFSEIKDLSISLDDLNFKHSDELQKLNKKVDRITSAIKKIPGISLVKNILK